MIFMQKKSHYKRNLIKAIGMLLKDYVKEKLLILCCPQWPKNILFLEGKQQEL